MEEDKNFYVYEWYIIETGEVFYIGKGKNNRYKILLGRNKFFLDMYNTHNCDVRKIYENLTEKEAFQKEKDTIAYYRKNTNYRLTNQTDGGDGISGWIAPDIFKEKQSKLCLERWKNPEYREKIGKIRSNPNGPYKSKEFRDKISGLVSGHKNPNYQHYWSDEQKDDLRRKRKENPLYKKENNPNSKKIICLETGEIFNCIAYAVEKYHVGSETSFSIALKVRYRTAAGLHWAIFSDEFLDKDFRFKFLIDSLLMPKNANPVICLDDKCCYNSVKILSDILGYSYNIMRNTLKNNDFIIIKNKKYMLLRKYKGRYM